MVIKKMYEKIPTHKNQHIKSISIMDIVNITIGINNIKEGYYTFIKEA
jgi:hypothetical protein